ncbi:MAG: hypothetical protein LBP70_00030 [Mycoplasmataceae bacterium]|jgi:hypothetical protein|nr:hypothetical protein [Mycoplasmataceae bacterium]
MKNFKNINWSNESIDFVEYAGRVDEAIKEKIDDDLKQLCDKLASN